MRQNESWRGLIMRDVLYENEKENKKKKQNCSGSSLSFLTVAFIKLFISR